MMFDISLAQLMVVGVVGVAVTGRKDLPRAFHFMGSQVGKVVGLLQGVRARADQYAAQNELRQLQNELRSGLRELDQVRMELAVAASSQGMFGRNLGGMTPSANRGRIVGGGSSGSGLSGSSSSSFPPPSLPSPGGGGGMSGKGGTWNSPTSMKMETRVNPQRLGYPTPFPPSSSSTNRDDDTTQTFSFDIPSTTNGPIPLSSLPMSSSSLLPTTSSSHRRHSEKAALEEEWEKQGIGYQTRAEQLYKDQRQARMESISESETLESLIKQQLLWDQYDRVVEEQNSSLQRRIDEARNRKMTTTKTTNDDVTITNNNKNSKTN